jgi:acyl-coenzyme A synthetase/AMP-(fatty) acid ligase
VTELRNDEGHVDLPYVPADRLVAMVFTSGSTGQAKANMKYWGSLNAGTKLLAARFGFFQNTPKSVVATVVPQHMFGLETSVLLPMLTNTCIHSEKPFYPADISKVLSELKSPGVLVTTPVHLKACVNTEIEWPDFEFVLSATAPLSNDLASSVQQQMGAEVREIFGCTEAGSFASRTTVKDNAWKLYETFSLINKNGLTVLHASHLTEQVVLSDVIEEQGGSLFKVLGRSADMLKIAGKRASLADLNYKLNSIENVRDGVFFVPDEMIGLDKVTRLCAFVVAPSLTESEILASLSELIDSVFLPRPLIKVNQLPYNDIGKIPRKALADLFDQYRSRTSQ